VGLELDAVHDETYKLLVRVLFESTREGVTVNV